MTARPTCATCKHWQAQWEPMAGEDASDILGQCLAVKALPHAFRWAWREVVWTNGDEPPADEPCAFHAEKDTLE